MGDKMSAVERAAEEMVREFCEGCVSTEFCARHRLAGCQPCRRLFTKAQALRRAVLAARKARAKKGARR